MKYSIVKHQYEGNYFVIMTEVVDPRYHRIIADDFEDEDEALELLPEIIEAYEYQLEQSQEQYEEENRYNIRQSELYEQYRNEY